jgi:hypothetical protein
MAQAWVLEPAMEWVQRIPFLSFNNKKEKLIIYDNDFAFLYYSLKIQDLGYQLNIEYYCF